MRLAFQNIMPTVKNQFDNPAGVRYLKVYFSVCLTAQYLVSVSAIEADPQFAQKGNV